MTRPTSDVAMNVNLVDVVQSHIKWAGMVLVDEVSGKIVEKGVEHLISRLASAGVFLVTEQDLAQELRRPFGDRITLSSSDATEGEGMEDWIE